MGRDKHSLLPAFSVLQLPITLPTSCFLSPLTSRHLPLSASHPSVFVHSSDLAGGHPDLVGVKGQAGEESTGHHRAANRRSEAESHDVPLDAIGVSKVVSLRALLVVEEDDHGGDKVDDLAGGQQVDVGPAVFSPVAVPDIHQSRTHLPD